MAQNERDARKAIEDEYNAEKEATNAEYDLRIENADNNIDLANKEYEAVQESNAKKLENAQLYKEARIIMEKGLNEDLIKELQDYEDKYGKGMGVLGDIVKDKLTKQIETAREAMNKLIENVAILSGQGVDLGVGLDRDSILSQMKSNSDAWGSANEEERQRLALENEKLGSSIGLVKDSGLWYTDETKTKLAYDTLAEIGNMQKILVEDGKTQSTDLYNHVFENLQTFESDTQKSSSVISGYIESLSEKVKKAISYLNNLIRTSDTLSSVDLEMTLNHSSANEDGTSSSWREVERFQTGGLNKTEGLKYLEPGEQVLTAEQTRGWTRLVDGLLSNGAYNVQNLQYPNVLDVNSSGNKSYSSLGNQGIEMNWHIENITEEALPKLKAYISSEFSKFEEKIPSIVAKDRFVGSSRAGFNFGR